jgi:HEAT repeat protein
LGGVGADAREAVPLLRGAAQDGDPAVREAAQHALKKIDLRTSGN